MILSLIAIAAAQAAPFAPPAGIWEGTVGTLPVRACFAGQGDGAFGAYYYRARMQLIALEAVEGARGSYREGAGGGAGPLPDAPRWRIERVDGSRLTARWTSGGRTLPVRLRRVAGAEDEMGPCGGLAFHQPRLAGVHIVRTRGSTEGVAWTKLRLDHGGRFNVSVETFALDGDGEAVRRLNAIFGAPLNGNPPTWLDCIRGALDRGPYEGEWEEKLEPAMIARRWLSVAARDGGYCGGAHPNWPSIYRTFDVANGREIDLHDWLNADAVKRERFPGSDEESKTLQPAFRAFILTGWHAETDCDEVVRSAEYWNIGLTRDGLVFSPSLPHVAQACYEEFVIGFDRLRPWLTRDGSGHISALQAERPAPAR